MTLIVALKYKDGVVLASDSRVMYGPTLKRDQARKLEPLTENIGTVAAGLVGAIDDVLRVVKEFCSSRVVTFDEVVSYLSDVNYKWYEENYKKLEEGEAGPVFIVVSPERIRRIFEKGYSEEAYDYACEGSGRAYGEYILRNFYDKELDVEQAKDLAVYTIVETSKMDPSVGEDISLLLFPKGGKCEPVDKAEIESIKERLVPLSRKISEAQLRTVEEIVKKRESINDLWKKKFPIHITDPKFVEVVIKICGKYPPPWTNLWLEALSMYKKSVDKLLECLQKGS